MTPESRQLATSLAQVLENFQRCGVRRFGSLPASQLPAQWLECLAELQQPQLEAVADISPPISPPAAGEPSGPANAATVFTGAGSPAGQRSEAVLQATTLGGNASPAGVAVGGLAVEPWSLPVLSDAEQQQRLELLNSQVCDCRRCSAIVGFRQQTVFGDGPSRPAVCFMGEAPGADEDRTGKPFVGKAGQLLTKIIAAMKLRREEVYILNALKCRPPQNRTPVSDEIDNCRTFVEQQLDLLQPRFIVCLGAVAVRSLLQSELSIGRLRGRFHHYRGARVVVTYHPSYLLRNESAKKLVWEDMKMLMGELA